MVVNDVLDKFVLFFNELFEGCVVFINWGFWVGAGMVFIELEKEYEQWGIFFIDLDKGIEVFFEELKYGAVDDV